MVLFFVVAFMSCGTDPQEKAVPTPVNPDLVDPAQDGEGEGSGLTEDYSNTYREIWQKPDLVLQLLGGLKGKTVADIGAGSGYFSFRMAAKVPEGKVYAVDIQPEMLDLLRARAEEFAKHQYDIRQIRSRINI